MSSGARVSAVPIVLNEPICTLADINCAAGIGTVGFCKRKLRRFGGRDLLREALNVVRQLGAGAAIALVSEALYRSSSAPCYARPSRCDPGSAGPVQRLNCWGVVCAMI